MGPDERHDVLSGDDPCELLGLLIVNWKVAKREGPEGLDGIVHGGFGGGHAGFLLHETLQVDVLVAVLLDYELALGHVLLAGVEVLREDLPLVLLLGPEDRGPSPVAATESQVARKGVVDVLEKL